MEFHVSSILIDGGSASQRAPFRTIASLLDWRCNIYLFYRLDHGCIRRWEETIVREARSTNSEMVSIMAWGPLAALNLAY